MERLLFAAALAATAFPAFASDLGASIIIGQPGFDGRLDIGGYPQPQVIYLQPQVMYQAEMTAVTIIAESRTTGTAMIAITTVIAHVMA